MVFTSAVQAAEEVLIEFLEGAKAILIDDLDMKNRNATGRTKKAINVVNVTKTSGQLVGPEHVLFTFQGRAPGKMPPLSNIIDWCVARNIPRAAAWIIAKRISEAGTRLFREGAAQQNAMITATSEERVNALKEGLQKIYVANLQSDFSNLINK